MKIHECIHYIKRDMWELFLVSCGQYGFNLEGRFVYPESVVRNLPNGDYIQINISEPNENIWSGEDTNKQREIWLWTENGKRGYGGKEKTTEFIEDLINAGFVERSGSGE